VARTRRPSPQTAALVRSFGRDPSRWRYGYALCQELGIKPGSMYPILMRLADRGFLETTWEADPEPGRPPRHLYRLTGAGAELAADLADAAVEQAAAARAGSLRRVAPTTRPSGATA
jgi:PadR family transcriptional regulator